MQIVQRCVLVCAISPCWRSSGAAVVVLTKPVKKRGDKGVLTFSSLSLVLLKYLLRCHCQCVRALRISL